jgi:hypothetical protein
MPIRSEVSRLLVGYVAYLWGDRIAKIEIRGMGICGRRLLLCAFYYLPLPCRCAASHKITLRKTNHMERGTVGGKEISRCECTFALRSVASEAAGSQLVWSVARLAPGCSPWPFWLPVAIQASVLFLSGDFWSALIALRLLLFTAALRRHTR